MTFCRRIELDYENNKILKSFHSLYVACEKETGLKLIETENIQECVRRERYGQPAQYKYLGTRYVFRVEDEKKFLLLLIKTGLHFKEVNPNSYSMSDEGND
jgi:hypothetical protein